MALIELNGVTVTYGGKKELIALDSISLTIEEGESVAITGPSGSGKSTILSVLGGLLAPKSGEYRFRGQVVSALTGRSLAEFRGEQIGFVFQDILLLPQLTLLENVMVPLEHLRIARNEGRERALAALNQTGIAHLADRFPREVSGGQAQRAAIARALIRNPRVILADEPTGSLDEKTAGEIISLLQKLTNQGVTLVVVTHSQAVAESLSRSVHINQGTIASMSQTLLVA